MATKCTPPTDIQLSSKNGRFNYIFDDKIKISWQHGQAGDGVSITAYLILYEIVSNPYFIPIWNFNNWKLLCGVPPTENNVELPILDLIPSLKRGEYIRFKIQTKCNNSNYDSDFSESTHRMMRVDLPPDVSDITISTSEFSSGDEVKVSWSYKCNNYGNNYKSPVDGYEIYGRYLDKDANPSTDWLNIQVMINPRNMINGQNISVNLTEDLTDFYNNIKNEAYAEIAIIPYDAFGNAGSKNINDCVKVRIFRYDRSGVSIGINGKWIPCQIYYGVDGAWIQCDVSAGVESSWKQCSG